MKKKHKILLGVFFLLVFFLYINNNCFCNGGNDRMNEKKELLNLVTTFCLQDTDKIIIQTNKVKFQEKPYIKKTITSQEDIKEILDSLKKNVYLNGLIKAETHYNIIFYKNNIKVFEFMVNDWKDGGFIRVNYKNIHSDFLPDTNFYKVFHMEINK